MLVAAPSWPRARLVRAVGVAGLPFAAMATRRRWWWSSRWRWSVGPPIGRTGDRQADRTRTTRGGEEVTPRIAKSIDTRFLITQHAKLTFCSRANSTYILTQAGLLAVDRRANLRSMYSTLYMCWDSPEGYLRRIRQGNNHNATEIGLVIGTTIGSLAADALHPPSPIAHSPPHDHTTRDDRRHGQPL